MVTRGTIVAGPGGDQRVAESDLPLSMPTDQADRSRQLAAPGRLAGTPCDGGLAGAQAADSPERVGWRLAERHLPGRPTGGGTAATRTAAT
ncbi:hypothetical protein GCM10017744_024860 [Streptomyces antimycoticus]